MRQNSWWTPIRGPPIRTWFWIDPEISVGREKLDLASSRDARMRRGSKRAGEWFRLNRLRFGVRRIELTFSQESLLWQLRFHETPENQFSSGTQFLSPWPVAGEAGLCCGLTLRMTARFSDRNSFRRFRYMPETARSRDRHFRRARNHAGDGSELDRLRFRCRSSHLLRCASTRWPDG